MRNCRPALLFLLAYWMFAPAGCMRIVVPDLDPGPSTTGITLIITDRATGDWVSGATVVASTSGGYKTWLFEAAPGRYMGTYLPGTYTVTIEAKGYQPHTEQNIEVAQSVQDGVAGLVEVHLLLEMDKVDSSQAN